MLGIVPLDRRILSILIMLNDFLRLKIREMTKTLLDILQALDGSEGRVDNVIGKRRTGCWWCLVWLQSRNEVRMAGKGHSNDLPSGFTHLKDSSNYSF